VIREFRDEDAPDAAALLSHLMPEVITTTAGLLHSVRNQPTRARRRDFVAVEKGHVVGLAKARFRRSYGVEGVANVWVGVRPDRRRHGLGAQLYSLAVEHVLANGAWKIESGSARDSGRRFLEHRGFHVARASTLSALDPAAVDLSPLVELEAARAAEGFRLVPLAAVRGRVSELHEVYAAGELDMPGDEVEDNIGPAEWAAETLEHPHLDDEGSFVVLADERPVSLAFLLVDRVGGRAENEMTATLREFRHRGLARLAKLATIRWAREHGIRTILTENDAENRDMLALNLHLGYRPLLTEHQYAREVGEAPPSASRGTDPGSGGRA